MPMCKHGAWGHHGAALWRICRCAGCAHMQLRLLAEGATVLCSVLCTPERLVLPTPTLAFAAEAHDQGLVVSTTLGNYVCTCVYVCVPCTVDDYVHSYADNSCSRVRYSSPGADDGPDCRSPFSDNDDGDDDSDEVLPCPVAVDETCKGLG